jgi:hypothetical protein
MEQGIYILANDRVYEETRAFLNSVRTYNKDTDVVLIPFDQDMSRVSALLSEDPHGHVLRDMELVDRQAAELRKALGRNWPRRINRHRTHLCWFGPLERFLYLDIDMVVFRDMERVLSYLTGNDLVWCDHQFRKGLRFVFSEKALEEGVVRKNELELLFNGGFWASRKGLFSFEEYLDVLRFCGRKRELLDMSSGGSDQPILNMLALKLIDNGRKLNLAALEGGGFSAGSWAGSDHFIRRDHKLFDPERGEELAYLHWAGIKIRRGCPYWDIWEYYRGLEF